MTESGMEASVPVDRWNPCKALIAPSEVAFMNLRAPTLSALRLPWVLQPDGTRVCTPQPVGVGAPGRKMSLASL
ncbi:hypothetical protein D3C72_1929810 [compost metagenome]